MPKTRRLRDTQEKTCPHLPSACHSLSLSQCSKSAPGYNKLFTCVATGLSSLRPSLHHRCPSIHHLTSELSKRAGHGLPRTAMVSSLVLLWLLAIFFTYDFRFSSTPLTKQVPSMLPDSLVYSLGKYDAYANPRAKPRRADFPLLEAHLCLNWTFINEPVWKWRTANENTHRRLAWCMIDPSGRQCEGHWNKVIFMASGWMKGGIFENWKGSEGVWGRSMVSKGEGSDVARGSRPNSTTLCHQGYSLLFAEDSGSPMFEVASIYRVVPEFIFGVFLKDIQNCYYQATCVKTLSNPTGIPVWKIFHLKYFPGNPGWGFESLTPAFKITAKIPLAWPDNSEGDTDLGFSLEEECKHHPYVPQAEHQQRVYIYGKDKEYFAPDRSLWPMEFFSRARDEIGVDFVAGFSNHSEGRRFAGLPIDAVQSLGFQTPAVFMENVALSKLMLGLGGPKSSPSP